jgi:hypothetical protein
VAADATLAEVTVTAAAAGGAGAGTAAALGGAAAAGVAASDAASTTTAAPKTSTLNTTLSEASAVATGASALMTLAKGSGRVNVPPIPNSIGNDMSVDAAEQAARTRAEAAGGLNSTVGTSGGQAGAVLNPSTMSQKSLLGG